jgi:hypothetical protein
MGRNSDTPKTARSSEGDECGAGGYNCGGKGEIKFPFRESAVRLKYSKCSEKELEISL